MEEDRVENLWAKTPSQATYFLSIFLYCHIIFFSFPFPGILGIPHICHFFTQSNFLENKIYTEKRQFFALNL